MLVGCSMMYVFSACNSTHGQECRQRCEGEHPADPHFEQRCGSTHHDSRTFTLTDLKQAGSWMKTTA